ncbi:MAG TPA: glycosyltransferase family 4 protein [Patescibacteria group bacterium]|nr:glycosyltransferase family 4 protein [Patescibacteria group bacterium]
MKIAVFHELHKGGARRGTNEFAHQLKKRGHTVDLFTVDNIIAEEKEFYNKINVYKFKPVIWKGHDWRKKLYKDTVELFKLFLLDRRIAKDINQRKYDLVYVAASQYIESPFILQFLKQPTFFYCNDPYYRIIYELELFHKDNLNFLKLRYEFLNRFIRKYLDRWNIGKAKYIIAISEFSNQLFYNAYKRKGDVVCYGAYTSFFVPSKKEKNIDILFIGSADELDGYPLFKEIIKKMKYKVKSKVVLFEKEWLNDKELLDVYQRSKILIALAHKEPFGMVPLEAMSCGAIVVAVNEGGHKETIKNHETGFLIERDAVKFAKKIDWLLENPDIVRKMSRNARREMIKNWDWDKKGEELEKLLLDKLHGLQN